jgi:3',5'-cyclic AMP phosphodiesterase CpdA
VQAVRCALRVGPLHLLTLGTVVHDQSHGELCDARLDWFEAELATRTGEPMVIAMHHPPFTALVGHMGKVGLMRGSERLGWAAATGVVSHCTDPVKSCSGGPPWRVWRPQRTSARHWLRRSLAWISPHCDDATSTTARQ